MPRVRDRAQNLTSVVCRDRVQNLTSVVCCDRVQNLTSVVCRDRVQNLTAVPRQIQNLTSSTTVHNMQSAAISSEGIIEASVKVLLSHLEREWVHQNLPKGIGARLEQARTSKSSATERILLEHGGIETWVAYFRATYSKLHFEGQKFQNTILAALQELSKDDQIRVASRVARGRLHSSIADIINNLALSRKRRSK